ncbi:Ctsb [Symbiodinium microadriaticum]|nr:Ctsb [Symbiodinium microadriaticum]
MSFNLRRISNPCISTGRNSTIIMDPDWLGGKTASTVKPNVGLFAVNGYKCHPPRRTAGAGPRPADVRRLSAPARLLPKVQSLPTLQAKSGPARGEHLPGFWPLEAIRENKGPNVADPSADAEMSVGTMNVPVLPLQPELLKGVAAKQQHFSPALSPGGGARDAWPRGGTGAKYCDLALGGLRKANAIESFIHFQRQLSILGLRDEPGDAAQALVNLDDDENEAQLDLSKKLEALTTELREVRSRSVSPAPTPRRGDNSGRAGTGQAPSTGIGSTAPGGPVIDDWQLVLGGYVDAKREEIQQEIRELFQAAEAVPLLRNIITPYVRSNIARIELLYVDDNLPARRRVQQAVLNKLRQILQERDKKSNLPGQTGQLWISRNRSIEERNRNRAILGLRDYGRKFLPENEVDFDWKGRVWYRGAQVLFHADRDSPAPQALMMLDARGLFLQLKLGAASFALASLHLPHDQREDAFDVWTSTIEQVTQALGNVPVGHSVMVGGDFNQPLHTTQDTFSPMAQLRLLIARFRLRISEDVGPTWHARGLEAPLDFLLFRHEGMIGSAIKREDLRMALPSDHDLVLMHFQAAPRARNRNRIRRDRCGRWCLQTEQWGSALAQLPDDPSESDLSAAFWTCSFRPKFPRYRDSELIRDLIRRRKISTSIDERTALAQEIACRRAEDKASFKQDILDRARTGDFAAISHLRRSAAQTKVAGSYIQARGGQDAATKELKDFYDSKYDTKGPGPSPALITALSDRHKTASPTPFSLEEVRTALQGAKIGTAAGSDGVTYEALLAFAASDKAFKLVNLFNSYFSGEIGLNLRLRYNTFDRQGAPVGANVINLSPPPQQDTVTVWMEGDLARCGSFRLMCNYETWLIRPRPEIYSFEAVQKSHDKYFWLKVYRLLLGNCEPHSTGELHQYAVADALWHGHHPGRELHSDAASRRRFCAGLRKLLQKEPLSFKRVVAATLHPDMVDLLRPRWMLDTGSATLWRSPAEPEMGQETSVEQLGDSEMPRFEAEQLGAHLSPERGSAMAAIVGPSSNGVLGGPGHHAVDSHADVDATMNAFSQWLSEMKARSNGSLQAMMAEMSVIRDGITSNSADLTEYKRHSISVQQQMQSQLTDLREKLTSAFTEITSLVKQKAATDQELLSEIHALGRQLSMKTAELEALKKSYSATHQQLQHSLVQLQGQLQSTSSEIVTSKRQVQATQDTVTHKMKEVEQLMVKLRDQVDSGGREGNATALAVQEDIAKLHEALTGLSGDFFEHKRLTQQVQSKLLNQVAALEDGRQRSASLLPQDGDYVVSASAKGLRAAHAEAEGVPSARRWNQGLAALCQTLSSAPLPELPAQPGRHLRRSALGRRGRGLSGAAATGSRQRLAHASVQLRGQCSEQCEQCGEPRLGAFRIHGRAGLHTRLLWLRASAAVFLQHRPLPSRICPCSKSPLGLHPLRWQRSRQTRGHAASL